MSNNLKQDRIVIRSFELGLIFEAYLEDIDTKQLRQDINYIQENLTRLKHETHEE